MYYPYNSIYPNIQTQPVASPSVITPITTHVMKVNGINGANAISLAPNSDALALDEREAIAYFVQTDGAGYKTVTAYDISIHKSDDTLKQESLETRLKRLEEYVYKQSNTATVGTGNSITTA